MPRFTIYQGRKLQQLLLLDQEYVTLGRHPHATIVLNDKLVSRRHAAVRKVGDGFRMEEFESANGVFVNELRLLEPALLQHGDRVGVGTFEIIFEIPPVVQRKPPSNPFTVDLGELLRGDNGEDLLGYGEAREMRQLPPRSRLVEDGSTEHLLPEQMTRMQSQLARRRQAHLRSSRRGVTRYYPLDERQRTLIGKSEECHVVVEAGLTAPRLMVEIVREGERLLVRSLSRFAGLRVNGEKVRQHLLDQGDELLVGRSELEFFDRV